MCVQNLVNFLTVFLKNKSVFFTVYIFFKVGKIREQIACVFVLRCSRNKSADFFYFGK